MWVLIAASTNHLCFKEKPDSLAGDNEMATVFTEMAKSVINVLAPTTKRHLLPKRLLALVESAINFRANQ